MADHILVQDSTDPKAGPVVTGYVAIPLSTILLLGSGLLGLAGWRMFRNG